MRLGWEVRHGGTLYVGCWHMVVTVTLCCAGGIPGLQNYNMQSGLQNRYFAQPSSLRFAGTCPFQPSQSVQPCVLEL